VHTCNASKKLAAQLSELFDIQPTFKFYFVKHTSPHQSPGGDVMILKIFSPENWRVGLKVQLSWQKTRSWLWFQRKTPIFFAENWRKS
jgi:hypothetical protein